MHSLPGKPELPVSSFPPSLSFPPTKCSVQKERLFTLLHDFMNTYIYNSTCSSNYYLVLHRKITVKIYRIALDFGGRLVTLDVLQKTRSRVYGRLRNIRKMFHGLDIVQFQGKLKKKHYMPRKLVLYSTSHSCFPLIWHL